MSSLKRYIDYFSVASVVSSPLALTRQLSHLKRALNPEATFNTDEFNQLRQLLLKLWRSPCGINVNLSGIKGILRHIEDKAYAKTVNELSDVLVIMAEKQPIVPTCCISRGIPDADNRYIDPSGYHFTHSYLVELLSRSTNFTHPVTEQPWTRNHIQRILSYFDTRDSEERETFVTQLASTLLTNIDDRQTSVPTVLGLLPEDYLREVISKDEKKFTDYLGTLRDTCSYWLTNNNLQDFHGFLNTSSPSLAKRLLAAPGRLDPPLHIVVRDKGSIALAKQLIFAGEPIDEEKAGETALTLSIKSGDAEMCLLLLAAGANPNLTHNEDKKSPFHMATSVNDKGQIAFLLLYYGADITAKDKNDGSVVDYLHKKNWQHVILAAMSKLDSLNSENLKTFWAFSRSLDITQIQNLETDIKTMSQNGFPGYGYSITFADFSLFKQAISSNQFAPFSYAKDKFRAFYNTYQYFVERLTERFAYYKTIVSGVEGQQNQLLALYQEYREPKPSTIPLWRNPSPSFWQSSSKRVFDDDALAIYTAIDDKNDPKEGELLKLHQETQPPSDLNVMNELSFRYLFAHNQVLRAFDQLQETNNHPRESPCVIS